MHRFFVHSSCLQGDTVVLQGDIVHQIKDVLRLQPGDSIVVLDDSGWEYQVRIRGLEQEQVSGQIEQKVLTRTEPRAKITLYQSLLKGDKLEWVLQKGTELGVVEFVPTVSDRCIISSVNDVSKSKFERWQRIILEAAEQSRRARLPRLHPPVLLPQACERARLADLAVMPWEEESKRTLRSMLTDWAPIPVKVQGKHTLVTRRPFSIHIFIGPEGGFTPREVDQARRYSIVPVSLGARILRAETAALAAATIVLYQLEDI
ncbi:MAG: 16S rRNA (uracil(1498)-N(3))-methyltransferase [Chloroflexi bacterium]|nr:16S rRNA (uracil(1498)-N(3))-methyltransferase [Chloroflexota bacterium]